MRINAPGRMLRNFKILRKYGLFAPAISLEASSVCQLRCPCCNQTTGDKGITTSGFLKFENFKWFVETYPEFERIELSCWGEPFLNPQMDEIMAFAQSMDVGLAVRAGSNFNTISKETIENLVKYRFRHVTIAIDGTTPEVYQIYRQRGDFDTVIRNIKLVNEFKAKYGSSYPELRWQFIVFEHNEHQIAEAEKMASELKMIFQLKLNAKHSYAPVKNKEILREKLGAATPREYWVRNKKTYMSGCSAMWIAPQITWDGKFTGCCVNKWGDFGNVFESGLEACLSSERFRYAKKMVTGKAKARDDIPCNSCSSYRNKIKEGPLYSTPGVRELAWAILKR